MYYKLYKVFYTTKPWRARIVWFCGHSLGWQKNLL